MNIVEKRIYFTVDFVELVVWGNAQPDVRLIIDEVRRGLQQAHWNASHCRVVRHQSRCELTPNAYVHNPGNGGHLFVPIGLERTVHGNGLAGDLLAYLRGVHLQLSEDYLFLGEKWESMTRVVGGYKLDHCWGGRFKDPDGGHFSLKHGSRK